MQRRWYGFLRHQRLQQGDYFPIQLRSEEHTSELQSLTNLVCRLLLEKKNSTSGTNCSGSILAFYFFTYYRGTRF